ncbi:MAG: division/cell wall cluster transcriptional repressor MraZ [Immundisolibacteraceae bacterium]|nr:division/cell wall cluster transcriptional repressor MraZ [Immundisolibacteraceae bacterium]
MFRGVNNINLDAKGRMAVPARHRDLLARDGVEELMVTLAHRGNCLLIYPMPEWELIERRLVKLSDLNESAYQLKQILLGHASHCALDGSGRILIPPLLREHVEIDKHSALVGMGNKLELWQEQNWSAQRSVNLSRISEMDLESSEELAGLTL